MKPPPPVKPSAFSCPLCEALIFARTIRGSAHLGRREGGGGKLCLGGGSWVWLKPAPKIQRALA